MMKKIVFPLFVLTLLFISCKKKEVEIVTFNDVILSYHDKNEKSIGFYLGDCLYLDTAIFNRICSISPEFSKRKIDLSGYVNKDVYFINLSHKYASIEEVIFSEEKSIDEFVKNRFTKTAEMQKHVLYHNNKLLIKYNRPYYELCLSLELFMPDKLRIKMMYAQMDN